MPPRCGPSMSRRPRGTTSSCARRRRRTRPLDPVRLHRPEIEYGERALRAASSAVVSNGKTVKVKTDILWDSPDSALIAESRGATIVCVGSAGIGWGAGRLLGSTAATLAEKARCPVVVVRRQPETYVGTCPDWLVVGVDNRAGNDLVVAHALEEARLRHAPVLAVGTMANAGGAVTYDELDRRVTRWRRDHLDVHIYPVSSDAGLASSQTTLTNACNLPSLALWMPIKSSRSSGHTTGRSSRTPSAQ